MFRATVKSDEFTYIPADAEHPKEIVNAAGGDLFHKAAPDVDTGDTKLETGESVSTTDGLFLVSDTSCEIVVRDVDVGTFDELVVSGKVTLSGLPAEDPEVAGELWVKEGVVQISAG